MARGVKGTGKYSKYKKTKQQIADQPVDVKPTKIKRRKLRRATMNQIRGLAPQSIQAVQPTQENDLPRVSPTSHEGQVRTATARLLLKQATDLLNSVR